MNSAIQTTVIARTRNTVQRDWRRMAKLTRKDFTLLRYQSSVRLRR